MSSTTYCTCASGLSFDTRPSSRCTRPYLWALKISYDHTVRDCDGSVVQFLYGDDAVDITKFGYMDTFEFMAENPELLRANGVGARLCEQDAMSLVCLTQRLCVMFGELTTCYDTRDQMSSVCLTTCLCVLFGGR